MKRKITTRFFPAVMVLAAFGYLILAPQDAAAGAAEGLSLCARVILPALFPYFVLTGLVTALGFAQAIGRALGGATERLFGVNRSASAALFLGMIGGYPLGAATAAELCRTGLLPKKDAAQALTFCNNAGPAFILGVCGGKILGIPAAGAALWGIHIAAAIVCGMLLAPRKTCSAATASAAAVAQKKSLSIALADAIAAAGETALRVCAAVVFFSVIVRGVESLFPHGSALSIAIAGLMELSSGAAATAALPFRLRFTVLAAILGWGGLCVHAQSAAVTRQAALPMGRYLAAKALHAALSAAAAWPLSAVFEKAVPAAAVQTPAPLWMQFPPLAVCAALCIYFLHITTGNPLRHRI